jgi:pimeloyl-ACP methyl ester carboxylesterase
MPMPMNFHSLVTSPPDPCSLPETRERAHHSSGTTVRGFVSRVASALAAFLLFTCAALAEGNSMSSKTVVLVHGAWADGSSWDKVIPLLEAKGLHVVAVQNPLSSMADDVAATTRVINMQTGPVILVGHSWGGAVISQAGNSDKVAALVYVSAFALDTGQSINDLLKGLPTPAFEADLSKDEAGYLYLSAASVAKYFAPDLSPTTQRLITATQGPWFYGSLGDKVTKAAWHDKPSWWVLSKNDRIIDPRLQHGMAQALHATVTEVASGHLSMLVKPADVANVIWAAAQSIN